MNIYTESIKTSEVYSKEDWDYVQSLVEELDSAKEEPGYNVRQGDMPLRGN